MGEPLFAVCTHGKRDRAARKFGRPLYDALRDQSDPEWVWQCTHVGGDRFAGNLVCFPEGLYFGRVGLGDVAPLLDHYLGGRDLPRLLSRPRRVLDAGSGGRARGTRANRADRVRRRSARRRETARVVTLEAAGESHELEVTRVEGEPMYLTCDSEEMKRPVRFVVA